MQAELLVIASMWVCACMCACMCVRAYMCVCGFGQGLSQLGKMFCLLFSSQIFAYHSAYLSTIMYVCHDIIEIYQV